MVGDEILQPDLHLINWLILNLLGWLEYGIKGPVVAAVIGQKLCPVFKETVSGMCPLLWMGPFSLPSSSPLLEPGSPDFQLSLEVTQSPTNKFHCFHLASQFESFTIKNLDPWASHTEADCLPAGISPQLFVWPVPTFSLTTIHGRGWF